MPVGRRPFPRRPNGRTASRDWSRCCQLRSDLVLLRRDDDRRCRRERVIAVEPLPCQNNAPLLTLRSQWPSTSRVACCGRAGDLVRQGDRGPELSRSERSTVRGSRRLVVSSRSRRQDCCYRRSSSVTSAPPSAETPSASAGCSTASGTAEFSNGLRTPSPDHENPTLTGPNPVPALQPRASAAELPDV
jgi:hypothetical protein